MMNNRIDNPELMMQNNNISHLDQALASETNSKVDLSKVDATEETMSQYTFPKEFLKLDLEKIREFIDILEEHYQKLVEQEDMVQAKSVKQRIILLKNLEKEKMKKEAKIIYSNQRELVQDKMKEELDNYIAVASKEYENLLQAFESQEVEMLKAQKQEIEEFKKNFMEVYEGKKPKPSKEILNWIKIRDYAMKQSKFDKVEEANKEINKLQKKDNQKFEKEKENKLILEINKINHRHENENNALQLKKNSLIDMFNQTKNRNIEQIQKKFDAKLKELKNYQSFEMSNFDKITKGITKPCARIQSIVSSTTGIRDDEDENDENEIKIDEPKENQKENEDQVDDGKEKNNVGDENDNNNDNKEEENNENNNDFNGEEQKNDLEAENEQNDENEEIEENNNINIDNEE